MKKLPTVDPPDYDDGDKAQRRKHVMEDDELPDGLRKACQLTHKDGKVILPGSRSSGESR